MGRRVRILGWVHAVLGGLGLAGSLLFCGVILASPDESHRELIQLFGPVFGLLALVYFFPSFVGGIGLIRGQPWGRALIWAESALLIFLLPVGTLLAGVNMWVLLSSRDRESSYGRKVDAVEGWLKARLGIFLAALGAIAILGVIVGLGYIFRDQVEQLPSPSESPLLTVVVFIIGVAIVVVIGHFAGWAGPTRSLSPQDFLLSRRIRRDTKRQAAEHDARLARLAADPLRAKYAASMERGEYWTDDQIAYDLDRNARATCMHLAPVEGAMRDAGLKVKLLQVGAATADCLVDMPALARAGLKAESVDYREVTMGSQRGYEDPPVGMLLCSACSSSIHVRNEHDKWPGIRTFPEKG